MTAAITSVMDQLATSLAAAQAARKVGRSLRDFNDIAESDLAAGVYTLLAGDEDGFPNYRGREGNFGTLQVTIVGQIKVAETATPASLEDAESLMIDEIKALTRSVPPAPIDSLVLIRYSRSKQLEHPYGWVTFELEVMSS